MTYYDLNEGLKELAARLRREPLPLPLPQLPPGVERTADGMILALRVCLKGIMDRAGHDPYHHVSTVRPVDCPRPDGGGRASLTGP